MIETESCGLWWNIADGDEILLTWKLSVAGPYLTTYDSAILVAGGIGVTPMHSQLAELWGHVFCIHALVVSCLGYCILCLVVEKNVVLMPSCFLNPWWSQLMKLVSALGNIGYTMEIPLICISRRASSFVTANKHLPLELSNTFFLDLTNSFPWIS